MGADESGGEDGESAAAPDGGSLVEYLEVDVFDAVEDFFVLTVAVDAVDAVIVDADGVDVARALSA